MNDVTIMTGRVALIARKPEYHVYRLKLPRFPCGSWGVPLIQFPGPRLLGINDVSYTDADGRNRTLPHDAYYTDTTSRPGRLILTREAWPQTAERPDAVRITYRTEPGEIEGPLRDPLGGF